MAIKTFTAGSVLTASDTNTYLSNGGLVAVPPATVAGTGVTLSNATVTFSAATAISLNNVFSATYTNYRMILTCDTGVTDALVNLRLRVGGVDANGAADYAFSLLQSAAAGTWSNLNFSGGTSLISVGYKLNGSGNRSTINLEISAPFLAQRTGFSVTGQYGAVPYTGGGLHAPTTSYDGFSIIPAAGSMTGTLTVYGYRL